MSKTKLSVPVLGLLDIEFFTVGFKTTCQFKPLVPEVDLIHLSRFVYNESRWSVRLHKR